MIKLNNMEQNSNEISMTKILSTFVHDTNKYIIFKIGKIYDNMKNRIFLIPELIFFISGLYGASILSNIDLLKGASIPDVNIVKPAIIMSLLSIAYNSSEMIKSSVKWWKGLKR